MDVLEGLIALSGLSAADLPVEARALAAESLYDWILCGRAGVTEPVAGHLRAFARSEGAEGPASVLGGGFAPARMAALVNGATSHALDYDDTHFDHVGHLSVGIYPAALAVGEQTAASAPAVVDAFLVGAEAAIRLGCVLGAAHYIRGFHQTATAGAFGATVAAGRLMGLGPAQMRAALGLCATRAAGLKSQFGTMGKPLNAGYAAANGVECAALAAAGLSSADDGIMGPQGFVPTHSDAPDAGAGFGDWPGGGFLFLRNSYKFHACCHGTHAMIEALTGVLAARPVAPGDVAAITLRTSPRWLSVCDIAAPRTGLEVKFSYRWLAGMVLTGVPTGDDRSYTDALAGEAEIRALAERMEVRGDEGLSDQQAAGSLRLRTGEEIAFAHDLSIPLPLRVLRERLTDKGRQMLGDEADDLRGAMAGLDLLLAAALGEMLRTGGTG